MTNLRIPEGMECWVHVILLFTFLFCTSNSEPRAIDDDGVPDYLQQDIDFLSKWEPPENFLVDYPYYLSGFDSEDSPIWVIEIGKWDVRKSIDKEQTREIKLYLQQFLMRAIQSRKLRSTPENPVETINTIIDLEGYGASQSSSRKTLATTLWFARQIEQAWRNKLKTGYFVNTNFVATNVWNLMKPLLGANAHKIEVFGTNRSRWLPILVHAFPKTEIPEWYGGIKKHKPLKVYG